MNNVKRDLIEEAEYDPDAEFLLKGIDFIQDLPYRIMGSGNQQIISSAEFIPKPDELWADVKDGQYQVEKTLFVQMKNDKLDQNSKLATLIQSSIDRSDDLKYALLSGGHLTPADNSENNIENCDDLVNSICTYINDVVIPAEIPTTSKVTN